MRMRKVLAWSALAIVLVAAGASVAWRVLIVPEDSPVTDLEPGDVKLRVVNACGVPRLARAVADELEARGYAVLGTGNEPGVRERTTVVDLLDPEGERAEKVAGMFSVKERRWLVSTGKRLWPAVSVRVDSTQFLDVLVLVGRDYRVFFPRAVVLR